MTWECFGGFYDHVAPPQVDQYGYGFRVPAGNLAVREAGMSRRRPNDHTSIPKFVEDRFGLSPLSIGDAAANNLAEALDFSRQAHAFVPPERRASSRC